MFGRLDEKKSGRRAERKSEKEKARSKATNGKLRYGGENEERANREKERENGSFL